jgi:DNA-binding MarR family transcriptional regulator
MATPRASADDENALPPQWLDADERAAWLSVVRIMTKLPSALDAQLERDADLNYFEYIVLAMLSEQPDGIVRMSELAAVTNASLSRLSHVAKRLEARELMRRAPDPRDGRGTHAILTEAGRAKVEQTAPGHVAEVRELVIGALSRAQLRQLRTANEHILARLDPDASTLPPAARPPR